VKTRGDAVEWQILLGLELTVEARGRTATELLFVKYMIDNLKRGGRCGVVVHEGVLSNS
jgi:hypothetical protein